MRSGSRYASGFADLMSVCERLSLSFDGAAVGVRLREGVSR
jgi:hypothetical protein